MPYLTVFLIALVLYVGVRLWLNLRQARHVKHMRDAVPAPFSDIISLADHQKAADYTLAKGRLGRWTMLLDSALLLLWTLGGGLQWTYSLSLRAGLGELGSGTLTILLTGLIGAVLALPASFYNTFVIESRFGFNRTTVSGLTFDMAKATLLGLILGTPLILLILWLMQSTGDFWWIWASASLLAFSLFAGWAFPTWIAPIFNKFEPLQNEALQKDILTLLQASGFESKGIYVMDGSRRSGHGNAYFSGFGKNKRIVFFDTLLEKLSPPQILAVLAHELGHFHHRHILKRLAMSAVFTLGGFAILAWLMQQPRFYSELGVETPTTALALLLFVLVSPVFTFFLEPLTSWFSRRDEFEADHYAALQTNPDDLVSALLKLYRDNASTLTPDPLYSAIYDSHPPALQRIQQLQRWQSA